PATSLPCPYTSLFRSRFALRDGRARSRRVLPPLRGLRLPLGRSRHPRRRRGDGVPPGRVVRVARAGAGRRAGGGEVGEPPASGVDRKSTRLNSSHVII